MQHAGERQEDLHRRVHTFKMSKDSHLRAMLPLLSLIAAAGTSCVGTLRLYHAGLLYRSIKTES